MTGPQGTPLRVWIDATDPRSGLRVFGMSLLERLLRALLEAGLPLGDVCVETAGDESRPFSVPRDLRERLPLRFAGARGSLAARLERAAAAAGPLLALEGDAIVDPRLLAHLARCPGSLAARGGGPEGRTAVLRIEGVEGEGIGLAPRGERLADVADAAVGGGVLKELPLVEVPDYLPRLRRHLPAYCFRVADAAARDRAERFLFWSNYKGSTDFFTRYVYPPLVWRLVGPLARWRVHPNWVSLLNVVMTLAAIPLFAAGAWVPGLVLAYGMSVLDSVDGKLARLTYRASKLGHVLDHGLDVIHPPLWYAAWAWALADGQVQAGVFQASLWMAGLYVLDRIATQCFTWSTGRSIHAYSELDVRMRTFISRRNINLPIFTLGLIAGAPVAAFGIIVAWQAATLAFHTARLLQIWIGGPRPDRLGRR